MEWQTMEVDGGCRMRDWTCRPAWLRANKETLRRFVDGGVEGVWKVPRCSCPAASPAFPWCRQAPSTGACQYFRAVSHCAASASASHTACVGALSTEPQTVKRRMASSKMPYIKGLQGMLDILWPILASAIVVSELGRQRPQPPTITTM